VPVPPGAVFLSYASEDAGAARRISDALRAAGIEVWFDQSELRGGDVWDKKIRQQIRDCALFLPIISAHSQARLEGYFRREWKLAVDRTHDMADEKPFLVPVAIDDVREMQAKVPDAFRAVQWTHLPPDAVPGEFAAGILGLLDSAGPAAAAVRAAPSPVPPPSPRTATPPARARRSAAVLMLAVAGVAATGYLLYERFMPRAVSVAPTPPASAAGAIPDAPAAMPQKSIAVLPFIDLSEKKDQEYFSDGLSEELLDLLAQVPDLNVAARTSSFYFKGKAEDVATIGQKLRVANVLEGSVRRAGNALRVTAQLINTANGYHLWSKTYDRDVKDIFKVQDDIANAVVEALKAKLLPTQQVTNRHQTSNTEAYTQYLLGNQYAKVDSPASNVLALAAYKRAAALDPGYAAAFGGICFMEWRVADQMSGEAAAYQRAVQAADKAIALAPDSPEGYLSRGGMRYAYFFDWRAADADFQKAASLDPDNVEVQELRALLLMTLGHVPQSIAMLRAGVAHDPLADRLWKRLAQCLLDSGEPEQAREALRRETELSLDSKENVTLGDIELAEGHTAQALAAFQNMGQTGFGAMGTALVEHTLGHKVESQRALDQLIKINGRTMAYQIGEVYAWRGERDKAFEWLERAFQEHDGGLIQLLTDPYLASLRADPRFKAFAGKMNLPV
jgi:TolB-like protein/Tfp pilus assembly protein PilF